ncbi:MAG: NAD(P)-dependent oxidoreductase [Gammaproteobacteria bacterium]
MQRPQLLITGINGLIGTVVRGPLGEAYDVYGVDINGPFPARVWEADISEYGRLSEAFERIGAVRYVVHLAAETDIDAPWDAILRKNIIGTRNVYEAARAFNVQRVVFASSNHVTGAYEGLEPAIDLHLQREPERLTVHDPIRPDSEYGVSKAFGEAVARYYCARFGVESVCLRIGSVRRDDDPTTHPRFMKTWLSQRDLVQLVQKSLAANVTFGIYYGISDNRSAFWDISNARAELDYHPLDDASRVRRG